MPEQDPEQPHARLGAGLALVLAGATTISFSAVLVKAADIDPSLATFYRTLFGSAFLLVWCLARGKSLTPAPGRRLRAWSLAALCGLLFVLDLEFWHRSIGLIGPGLATILANFQVFFLAAWGAFVLGERLRRAFALAVAMAFVGLWLLITPPGAALLNLPRQGALLGLGLGLATAVWYALYLLSLRRSQRARPDTGRPDLAAAPNMALVTLTTCLLTGALCLARGLDFAQPDTRSLLLMALYGLGPQALGWVLISTGLPRLPASLAGLVILLQPSLAFTWDILFFDRPTGPLGALGAVLAIGAIFLGVRSRPQPKKT